jgi:hypothetical protein
VHVFPVDVVGKAVPKHINFLALDAEGRRLAAMDNPVEEGKVVSEVEVGGIERMSE